MNAGDNQMTRRHYNIIDAILTAKRGNYFIETQNFELAVNTSVNFFRYTKH